MDKQEVILEFKKHLNEYIDFGNTISEVGEDEMNPNNQQIPGGEQNQMDNAPDIGGITPDDTTQGPIGGEPGMGDENPMGGDQIGDQPMGDDSQAEPEGFAPQGIDPNAGIDGMGGPEQNGIQQEPSENEEVIDVDELTNSQEETEKKIDSLQNKFEKLIDSLENIDKKIDTMSDNTNQYINSLKDEFEKRNPTPMQRMSMRSTKSTPYNVTTDEYMNNYAPDNYSDEDDNNGADDPQYKITRGDVDGWSDYASIEREFDGKRSLRDILGY